MQKEEIEYLLRANEYLDYDEFIDTKFNGGDLVAAYEAMRLIKLADTSKTFYQCCYNLFRAYDYYQRIQAEGLFELCDRAFHSVMQDKCRDYFIKKVWK